MIMKKVKRISIYFILLAILVSCFQVTLYSQEEEDPSLITIDRIFNTMDFMMQRPGQTRWLEDGDSYTALERSETVERAREIVKYDTKSGDKTILVPAEKLIPEGQESPLRIANYIWSEDKQQLLIFTNTRRVWRTNTRGDYWVLNMKDWTLNQLGKTLPESSLMFAKFSPDGTKVAYVSKHNLYVEDLEGNKIKQLTVDGSETLINGTFDWAYEEEFQIQDGFRWSPDSKNIAYWQLDASDIRNFLMINNTDSIYSYTIPVQYPKVGYPPSPAKIGVISASGGKTLWFDIPGDPFQHYLPRMMWLENSEKVLAQQMNRLQNTDKLWTCDIKSGKVDNIFTEKEETWVDVVEDWQWLDDGNEYLWISQMDGWRHLYKNSTFGPSQTLLTPGDYDVVSLERIDNKQKYAYYIASPDNATQRYLYRIGMDGKGEMELLSPEDEKGTHRYNISPNGKYAFHTFSNVNTPSYTELITLPDHETIRMVAANEQMKENWAKISKGPIEFFKVTTEDDVEMDGYMMKPPDFDPNKKYPVLFYVYGEPWGQTATDNFGYMNFWHTMLTQKGYIVMTMDNRGTPCPKGREWRKSIYKKVGVINTRDQAMGLKEIIKWDFVDPDRIAVWGWSGGGSMTLNLLFQFPELYQTGMAVAAVSNQLYYDNIYQERYMGLPQDNEEVFADGSPITYAENLEGNLLIVHGTADDNVHYQNAEALVNELIRHNKMFQIMPYPNRSHGIYEGQNTTRHLFTLLTNYLLKNTEPGGK